MNLRFGKVAAATIAIVLVVTPLQSLSASPARMTHGPARAQQSEGSGLAGPDIIGGREVRGEHPYLTALVCSQSFCSGTTLERFFCSGVLIKPDAVLTAAHCIDSNGNGTISFDELNYFNDTTALAIGRERLSDTSDGHVRYISYTDYTYAVDSYLRPYRDVAVVHLSSPTTLPDLDLAGSGDSSLWGNGDVVRLFGWGLTNYDGRPSDMLKTATNVVTYRDWSPTVFEGDRGGPDPGDACYGDSGGPVVVSSGGTYRVVGLVTGPQSTTSRCDGRVRYSKLGEGTLRQWVIDHT